MASPGLVPAGILSLSRSQEAKSVIRREEAPGHARQPGLQPRNRGEGYQNLSLREPGLRGLARAAAQGPN